jgi:hypothetical protein
MRENDVSGETDLRTLLRAMRPRLDDVELVFCTLPHEAAVPETLAPLMTFREAEGLTLIVSRDAADSAGLAWTFPCRRIALEVHSALDAIGFLAAIASRLADAGISVNPVSGFHHDHLFVPTDRAEAALAILMDMAG